jgi:hypothetical protein
MDNLRAFVLTALLICCGAAPSDADISGETDDAGQHPAATAQQATGGVGVTGIASRPRFSRLQCRRYFGCTPAARMAIGFTND